MAVGQGLPTLSQINGNLANIILNLNALETQIQQYFATMEAIPDGTLQAAPYGMSSADTALLRSAYRDLYKLLHQVRTGLMFVASGATAGSGVPTANDATHFGYDFTQFTRQCQGMGY